MVPKMAVLEPPRRKLCEIVSFHLSMYSRRRGKYSFLKIIGPGGVVSNVIYYGKMQVVVRGVQQY